MTEADKAESSKLKAQSKELKASSLELGAQQMKSVDKRIAPKKFEKVAQSARNFSSDRPRRDRRDRRDRKSDEPKQFEEQTIAIDRVARVVKGGRRFRFKALVVVGDRKNKVGVGVAKGQDVQLAVTKATDVAKKNMITFPMSKTTIPHEIEIKISGARVLLKPAAPGTGVIAGGVVRTILGTTGVTDLLSKSLGSSNKVNIAYATIKALESLVPKTDWIRQGQEHTRNSKVATTEKKLPKKSEQTEKEIIKKVGK